MAGEGGLMSAQVSLPDFIPPELATLTDKAPAGDDWVHEIKLDGYRTAARLQGGEARMLTRSGLDWTPRFRPIAAAIAVLKARTAYLDGEIVVLGADGVMSFAALQEVLSRGQADRLTYHVFDLLHLDGRDLRQLPLIERKALLAPLLARLPKGSPLRFSDHVQGQGPEFFVQACKHNLEGIVAKRAAATYRSGRAEDWLKVKCRNRQEFVIGGWMASDKPGRELRSLLLGYYEGGKLIFAGKAGTGFGLAAGRELARRLGETERDTPPFVSVPRPYQRGARWVQPRLVAEVTFSTWTADHLLRHPSFLALREDKPAKDVKLERAGIFRR
jgi:bifunctional non-homologous end joining protein LigD